jgi:hypothetical protein
MIGEFCPKVFALNVIRGDRGVNRFVEPGADDSASIGSGFRPALLFTGKRSPMSRFAEFVLALYFLQLR